MQIEAIPMLINSDFMDIPLDKRLDLADYKMYGEKSHVFQNKDRLHSLYECTGLSMNDLTIYKEAFEHLAKNNKAGAALAGIYGIKNVQILVTLTAMQAVAASSTAMQAVVASSTAMQAVAASSTAMQAVAASSTAMQAVVASSTAMQAVVASSTAMQAVAASSTAMQAVAASSTAIKMILLSMTAAAIIAESSTALSALEQSRHLKHIASPNRAASGKLVILKGKSNAYRVDIYAYYVVDNANKADNVDQLGAFIKLFPGKFATYIRTDVDSGDSFYYFDVA